MKRKLMILAAAVGMAAGSSAAQAQTTGGYMGLYGGGVFTSGVAYVAATVDAAGNIRFGNFNLQLETRGRAIFASTPAFHASAMVHAYLRTGTIAFGPFGGYENVNQTTTTQIWHIGAEGQVYLSGFTLYGQAAYIIASGAPPTPAGMGARALSSSRAPSSGSIPASAF